MVKFKRGFIRIIEATIGILIIVSVLLIVVINTPKNSEIDLSELIPPLLEEMAKNDSLRTDILTGDPETVEDKIKNTFMVGKLHPGISFDIEICDLDEQTYSCAFTGDSGDSEIYVEERVISSSTGLSGTPRKIRIYLWR